MTLGQLSFVENFNSLKQKVNINELSTMIQFCSLFRSDDVTNGKLYGLVDGEIKELTDEETIRR